MLIQIQLLQISKFQFKPIQIKSIPIRGKRNLIKDIKGDQSNKVENKAKVGDKCKDVKAGAIKANDEYQNGYCDEKEDDEYDDDERNVNYCTMEEEDVDMSLCGRTSGAKG